jgi:hypothetical protein
VTAGEETTKPSRHKKGFLELHVGPTSMLLHFSGFHHHWGVRGDNPFSSTWFALGVRIRMLHRTQKREYPILSFHEVHSDHSEFQAATSFPQMSAGFSIGTIKNLFNPCLHFEWRNRPIWGNGSS